MIRQLFCLAALILTASSVLADDLTLINLSEHAAQVRAADNLCLTAQQRFCESDFSATSDELRALPECDLFEQLNSFDAVDQTKFFFGQQVIDCASLEVSSTSTMANYTIQTICHPGQRCSQTFTSPEMIH